MPDVAVLPNITPDHIDRHGSMENYAAIKARLLRPGAEDGHAVIGVDDPYTAAISHAARSRKRRRSTVPVSVGKVLGRGIFAVDGALYDALGHARVASSWIWPRAAHLPGAHNWQNAALAYAATQALREGHALDRRRPSRAFPVSRIAWKMWAGSARCASSTTPRRPMPTPRSARCVCFNDIFWIAGGKPKAGGIESLAPHFARIRKAYLIGEAAKDFARTLDGHVTYEIATRSIRR